MSNRDTKLHGGTYDLSEFAARAPRRAGRRRRAEALPTETPFKESFGPEILFAARESDEYGYLLLDTMIQQILEPYGDRDEVARMLGHGSRVMQPGPDGSRLRDQLNSTPLFAKGQTRAKPVAYLITDGRFAFVYGLTSAGKAKTFGGTDNDWVDVLAEVIRDQRPQRLVTGPFSRMVRNKDFAGKLAAPLKAARTTVLCAEAPQGFVPAEPHGAMIWELLSQAAHIDYEMSKSRLLTGTLFCLKNNRWPRGAEGLPPGYRTAPAPDGGKPIVAPDEAQRHLVRLIIETAASDMTATEAAVVLGEAGLRSRGPRYTGERSRPIHEVGNPESAVARVWGHLPTYLSGRYEYSHANTLPDRDEMHGLKVFRADPADAGEFRLELNFGLPADGWHDPEVIMAAIRRRLGTDRNPPTTGSADRKPLSGLATWISDDRQYMMHSHDPSYVVRRRPAVDALDLHGTPKGFGHYEGELTARIPADDLHRAVSDLLHRVFTSAPTDIPATPPTVDVSALTARASEEESLARGLREEAALVDDEEEAHHFRDQAQAHQRTATSLRLEVQDAVSSRRLLTASELTADPAQLELVAELLRRFEERAPAALNIACRQLISRMEVDGVPGDPTAEVRIWVRLRTSFGTLKVGPLATSVRNTARRRRESGGSALRGKEVAARLLFPSYFPAEDIQRLRELEGLTPRSEQRRLLEVVQQLLPHRAAASALVDCPVEAVRVAVLGDAFGLPRVADPDLRFADEVRSTYFSREFAWPDGWARGDKTRARTALAWMARYVDRELGIPVAQLRERVGLSEPELYWMLSDDPAAYASDRAGNHAVLERTRPWPTRTRMPIQDKRVRLRACPHCQAPLVQVLRVPELPDGTLCSQCLRAPSTPFSYPEMYLQPWVGPMLGRRPAQRQGPGRVPARSRLQPFEVPPRLAVR